MKLDSPPPALQAMCTSDAAGQSFLKQCMQRAMPRADYGAHSVALFVSCRLVINAGRQLPQHTNVHPSHPAEKCLHSACVPQAS